MAATVPQDQCRKLVRISGQVQGVGFRPFVFRLANESGLNGFVRNDGSGVEIDVQGPAQIVDHFLLRLEQETPPLAEIDKIKIKGRSPRLCSGRFLIEPSAQTEARVGVTPDAAVCEDCVTELKNPADRRYRYPFINCTNCGPRYTLTRQLPYDRPSTSMADFVQCPSCQSEYDAPGNRRFHAQPNACPDCGPSLQLCDSKGQVLEVEDVLREAIARISAGEIIAIKGLGGFHLVCDAHNHKAVDSLRKRKNRDEKPFAVMVAAKEIAAHYAYMDSREEELLTSCESPIVLLRKKPICNAQLHGVAPGIQWLGVMLPYTPLHHLLFDEEPVADKPRILVMTSANQGGEPLVIDNKEAVKRLGGIADALVLHDRDIYLRCDDSVVRWQGQAPGFIRRARGYTPRAIRLPQKGPSVLACGGWFKNTVCLTKGDQAYLSQHIGDLDNASTCEALEETVEHLTSVLQIEPELVAHDLHPDFFSTRFAEWFALERKLPVQAVQHHHAHIAAIMAEHRIKGSVLGLSLDGVGLGDDGGLWGGELLVAENDGSAQRFGHFSPLALPGGDRASREPWRMAASALYALGRGDEIETRLSQYAGAETIHSMLKKELNCPETSSAGRVFDAAAGLLDIKGRTSYEGQAAMLLEGLAADRGAVEPLEGGYVFTAGDGLSLMPVLSFLADCPDAGYGAAVFHATLIDALVNWVAISAKRTGLNRVVLSGGCFLNNILARGVSSGIQAQGLEVFEAVKIPPNDGGISLGQAWVAVQRHCVEEKK